MSVGKFEIHMQISKWMEIPGWETSVMVSEKKGVTTYLTSYAPTQEVALEKIEKAVVALNAQVFIHRTKIEQIVWDERFE